MTKNGFHFSCFGLETKILNNNPPIKPPYKVEFNGLDVMAQVPLAQPTK